MRSKLKNPKAFLIYLDAPTRKTLKRLADYSEISMSRVIRDLVFCAGKQLNPRKSNG